MKIFIDSADVWAIKDAYETGLIDGVTTNPTLIMKSGRHPEKVYEKLKDMGIGDISMEVVGNAETMINEGRRLKAKFGDCATIKVPCTPDGLLACHTLSKELIRVSISLASCSTFCWSSKDLNKRSSKLIDVIRKGTFLSPREEAVQRLH